jgi:hypothetical protein
MIDLLPSILVYIPKLKDKMLQRFRKSNFESPMVQSIYFDTVAVELQ